MKRVLLLVSMLLLLVPSIAMAHSKLETAVPDFDSVVTTSPEAVELTFNETIEPISNLKLLDAAGEEIAIEKATVQGPVLRAAITEPLINGSYSVKWTIVGKDGHAVNGEYSFTVDAPEPEPELEPEPTPEAETAPDETENSGAEGDNGSAIDTEDGSAAESSAPTAGESATDSGNTSEDKSFNYTPIIIIAVIIFAAVTVISLRRRK